METQLLEAFCMALIPNSPKPRIISVSASSCIYHGLCFPTQHGSQGVLWDWGGTWPCPLWLQPLETVLQGSLKMQSHC